MRNRSLVAITLLGAIFFSANATELSEAARAQQGLLSDQAKEEKRLVGIDATRKALKERTASLFLRTYLEAKASGLKVEDPTAKIDELNAYLKREKLFLVSVVGRSEDGGVVYLTDHLTKSYGPTFAIVGYGLIHAEAELLDEQFDRTGRFSPQCRYQINVGGVPYEETKPSYECSKFLSGAIDNKVLADMKTMVAKAIKRKRPSGRAA